MLVFNGGSQCTDPFPPSGLVAEWHTRWFQKPVSERTCGFDPHRDYVKKVTEYRVCWSDADGEWVCTSPDFPSLSWLHADPVESLRGLQRLISKLD